MNNPWKTLKVKPVYNNAWISVSEHEVINPAGNPGIYGVVNFQHWAIGIIPVDDQGNTWLVGQYRYPLDAYSWEIPEGGGNLETAPLESAQRELLEEAGLKAEHWQPLCTLHTSNSCTNETAFIFLASGITEGTPQPEETEQLSLRKLPLTEAIQMALDGTITDAMSVAGLLKAKVVLGL